MVVTTDQSEFQLTYDGVALAEGRMPVGELAPALLALGELFKEVNRLANPNGPTFGLEIKAFPRGSFIVDLTLIQQAQQVTQHVIDALNAREATAAANLIAYICAGGGLFALIRRLGHRRITDRTQLPAGYTRLTLDDGTVFETYDISLEAYQNADVRENARRVIAPLERAGVEGLVIKLSQQEGVEIGKADLPTFDVPSLPDELILDTQTEIALTIVALSFDRENKWRFSDGEQVIWAGIDDRAFLDSVAARELTFGSGDILRARVRIQQWQSATGLKTERSVLEVLAHYPAARPLPLPFDEGHQPA